MRSMRRAVLWTYLITETDDVHEGGGVVDVGVVHVRTNVQHSLRRESDLD